MKSSPFRRLGVFIAAVQALIATGIPAALAAGQVGPYQSRGKGEGLRGNKHAKSSFKQNKRRGL